MRVLFLGFSKIAFMPYMWTYIRQLKTTTEADLVYWERDNLGDTEPPKVFKNVWKYSSAIEQGKGKLKKIVHYHRYRKLVLKILKDREYDCIICLPLTAGVPIVKELCKHYKEKYILDYRDLLWGGNPIYKKYVNKLQGNAKAIFVSSTGFLKDIATKKCVHIVHNYLADSLNFRQLRLEKPRMNKVLKIRYWGLIRHVECNLSIIKALQNDESVELHYHGREEKDARELMKYCKTNNIKNVYFHGAYKPNERYAFVGDTDILLNIYNNDAIMKQATSNKYYDGLIFYLPQICTKNSLMGDMVEKNEIGKAIHLNSKNIKEELIEYYNSIDWNNFKQNCDDVLQKCIHEQFESEELICKLINYKE